MSFPVEQGKLGVTGISRSGRVRKKSSKLMDFESPDDIDTRFKRNPSTTPHRPQQIIYRHEHGQGDHEYEESSPQHQIKPEDPEEMDPGSDSGSDFYEESPMEHQESMESDSEEEMLSDQEGSYGLHGDSAAQGQGNSAGHPSHSLYMMEKSNKKKLIVRDGKVIGRAKAQRKDKGKSRVTAYMLWARNARDELLRKNPELDFSAISKRLGEMWANVNFQERYLWKRKAKRLALKKESHASKPQMVSNGDQFAPRHQSTPVTHTVSRNRHTSGSQVSRSQPTNHNSVSQQQNVSPVSSNSGVYKVVGCGPVEVAAHLRLLGESLAIIGERLKEHEGQIAVSGSVSVLLDTLLCSLAPLICLTTNIPEIAPPTTLLQDTLDNIAYIMPGL